MAPKGIINSADINRQQRQRDAEQIIRKKAVVVVFRPAAKNVVERREAHADLEAHEKSSHDQLIHKMCVYFQESNIVD